jgi:hypothetical protein
VIERVVEDWLHNVNELGYEDSFAHALISEGHTIIHKQEHGSLELGKDLITRDCQGMYHCYQLKGGNINQGKWQQISGQIQTTVSSPIVHPNIPVGAPFTPYLVTNGTISDPVRIDIFARNLVWSQQHGRELHLILNGELLEMFFNLQSSFLPTKPRDFQLFLTLYLSDKREPLRCEQFSEFLISMLPDHDVTRAELRRLLAAMTIVADYVISEYEKVGNFFVASQAWGLLLFHLLRACEPHPDTRDWMPAIELVIESLERCVTKAVEETLQSTNWMEGNIFVDEHVWPFRCSSLVGLLAAYMIAHRIGKQHLENETDIFACIAKHVSEAKLWGEAAAPALFLAAQCLCLRGAELAGIQTAIRAIETIADMNGKKGRVGLPDPYYVAEEVMRAELLQEDVFGEKTSFAGRSFSIRQFVEFIVRRNWPDSLRKRWYRISEIDYVGFSPENPIDFYWWSSSEGSTDARRWAHPQSWLSLVSESLATGNDALLIDTRFIRLLPYLFLFMPHRFTPERARLLDVRLLLDALAAND